MMESIAWLLNFGDSGLAAVGRRELLHLVPQPESFEVPRTTRHCSRVLIWQSRVVPVWDINAWLRPGKQAGGGTLAAVLGYQSRRGQPPQFGAMMLAEPPRRIEVTDAQACELPRERSLWGEVASSCFSHEGKPVVVLDLPLMFSAAFAWRQV